jgi:hypothetical protein
MGAILYALRCRLQAATPGRTYTAYEALPARLKKRIDRRQAVHPATYNSAGIMRKGTRK